MTDDRTSACTGRPPATALTPVGLPADAGTGTSEYSRLMTAIRASNLTPHDRATLAALIFEVSIAAGVSRHLDAAGLDSDPQGVWTRVGCTWCEATGEAGWGEVRGDRGLIR